jgi:hypothetical protein
LVHLNSFILYLYISNNLYKNYLIIYLNILFIKFKVLQNKIENYCLPLNFIYKIKVFKNNLEKYCLQG